MMMKGNSETYFLSLQEHITLGIWEENIIERQNELNVAFLPFSTRDTLQWNWQTKFPVKFSKSGGWRLRGALLGGRSLTKKSPKYFYISHSVFVLNYVQRPESHSKDFLNTMAFLKTNISHDLVSAFRMVLEKDSKLRWEIQILIYVILYLIYIIICYLISCIYNYILSYI